MQRDRSCADWVEDTAWGSVTEIAVLGAALGVFISLRFGPVYVLPGFAALPLIGVGYELDRPGISGLRSLCITSMLATGLLLMCYCLAGMLAGSITSWAHLLR